jgi:hypothetical protein
MASTINASTSPAAIVQTADGTANLSLQSNGTTIAALTSTGMAVTGTLSASGAATLSSTLAVTGEATFANDVKLSGDAYVYSANGGGVRAGWFLDGTNQAVRAYTAATERMRIDSSGYVIVGTTATFVSLPVNLQGSGSLGQLGLRNSGATAGKYWQFGPNASNNIILYNNSSVGVYIVDGGTSWTGTSDERLKTNLKPIENAAEKVSTLRAVTGRFIADEENKSRAFLIAQDVQKVLPEAVDASDPEKLGIAYTDVIPLLVAAIKEQQALITSLTARITALEGA